MTNMSPTFHVQLSTTTFPPISNDLEAEKRSFHRQRSTRRLEAARKTTPAFLDLDSKKDVTITNSPTSPRTRAVRRKGQLFNPSTSPISSGESDDYIFVNAQVQSEPYSPKSQYSRIPPLPRNRVTNGNSNCGKSGKDRAGVMAKTKKAEGPQRLAQPFLLQLRSLPVPADIKPSNIPVTNNSRSLLPISSCSNMDDSTTATRPHDRDVLTPEQKSRKLAKLCRTLGETIPPELVFHSDTTTPSTAPLQRSTSVLDSSSRRKVTHKLSRSIPSIKASTSLRAVLSRAAAVPTTTSTPQSQPTREPDSSVEHQPKTRPRSMTTVPSPTMATPSNYGASLDHSTNPPIVGPETTQDALSLAWGRRKEREWSGEWNVKDMKQVAIALRSLKAR